MTVTMAAETMAAEALAWSKETDPAEIVPYPTDVERGAWTAAWAYAAWLTLAGLVVAAVITGTLILAHSDARPAASSEVADGGAAAVDAPIVSPTLPTIPDGPTGQSEDGSPDTAFLSALHTGAPGWNDTDSRYVLWGRWVCQSVATGRSLPDTITMLSSTPPTWTLPATRYFVKTAMAAYCPGSVG